MTMTENSPPMTLRPLFGGAISCQIPGTWRDVSDIRQVPDHQECWQSPDDKVMVVEILDYQDNVPDDQAVSYFFDDLAEANGSQEKQVQAVANDLISNLPSTVVQLFGIGLQKVKMGRDTDIAGNPRRDQEIRDIQVELCVIRLPDKTTDLLITLSKPICRYSEQNSAEVSLLFRQMMESFHINDWSLFG